MGDRGRASSWLMQGTLSEQMRRIFGISTGSTLVVSVLALASALWGVSATNQSTALNRSGLLVDRLADQAALVQDLGIADDDKARAAILARVRSGMAGVRQDAREFETIAGESGFMTASAAAAVRSDVEAMAAAIELAANGRQDARQEAQVRARAVAAKTREVYHALSMQREALGRSNLPIVASMVAFFTLTGIAALATFAFARRFLERELMGPVRWIRLALNKLARGEQDFEIEGLDRHDEIGEAARALAELKQCSAEFMDAQVSLANKAQEDLRLREEEEQAKAEVRIQHAELLRQLADRFETTVGEVVGGVASASSQLQVTATSMASVADQSSHQAEEVTQTLGEASAGVTAAASACDEFALSIGEISRQAATSAELARKATVAAASADHTISALTQSAAQVGEVVELISSIAQRTNLLALNASIEAARGGEAGRGFAVVASEVKDLATQTGKATEEVSQQIRQIQETTTASVEALRSIARQIQQLESTSVSIAAAVDQQSIAGHDLARSIDIAARNTEEVSSNIVQVRETALATGAAASQVLASSKELESQASTLRAQVNAFLGQVRAA